MATPNVEGFSISHAAILNGTTGAEETDGDIYGVREGSLDVDADTFDNEGDDQVLSTWNWINFATVNIVAGYIPFKTIALLTGAVVTSSGVAPNDYYYLPMWAKSQVNVSPKPMLLRVPSRDINGVKRTLDIVLYKVYFQPMSFDGPSYKDGLVLNYNGKAVVSPVDERGVALADPCIGRLISTP